jgi:hypothetical protein
MTDSVLLIIQDDEELFVTKHDSAAAANKTWGNQEAEHGWIITTAAEFSGSKNEDGEIEKGSEVPLSVMTDIYNLFADESPIEPFEDHATANGRLWTLLFEKLTDEPEPETPPTDEDEETMPAAAPAKTESAKKAKAPPKPNKAAAKPVTAKEAVKPVAKPAAKASTKTDGKTPAKKTAAPKAAATTSSATRLYPPDAKVKLVVKENPKRKGGKSHARFAKYRDGMTIEQALKAGVTAQDLKYDESKKFIQITRSSK